MERQSEVDTKIRVETTSFTGGQEKIPANTPKVRIMDEYDEEEKEEEREEGENDEEDDGRGVVYADVFRVLMEVSVTAAFSWENEKKETGKRLAGPVG